MMSLKLSQKVIGLYSEDKSDNIFTVHHVAHQLTDPVIISPLGGIVPGIVNVVWNPSVDLWHKGMSVTYGVYISADMGGNWLLLASNIPSTSFYWDTTQTEDCYQ